MKKIIYLFVLSVFVSYSCSEVQRWDEPSDSTPPGKISNPVVDPLNGGARITYTLPADDDLLGVKASYSFTEESEERETFSSAYNDTIVLKGFPDTQERTVKLICIDKSFNESEPVEVTIKPLTPPVELIRQSLKVNVTFGGLYAKWENMYEEDIAISLFAADSTGEMELDDTHYSDAAEGGYAFRGFDDSEREFEIQIRDRWDNYAEPLDTTLTPLFEEEINPRDESGGLLWSRYGFDDMTTTWRGDIVYDHPNGNYPWTYAIDDITVAKTNTWISTNTGNLLSYWADDVVEGSSGDKEVWPMYFTLDLGREVSLSRHKLWHRGRNTNEDYLSSSLRYYQQGDPKYYEIWATNTPPKQPQDFNNKMESLAYWTEWPEVGGTDAWKSDWVKLADCSCLPPSGNLSSELTTDDLIFADEGFEAEVAPELTGSKFRYIRFVVKELWYDSSIFMCAEIKFYGAEATN